MTRTPRMVLIATILGSAVVFLDGTVVNLALPAIAKDLHASFSVLQWIVDGYTLSLSALLLLGGSLGDILGRKKIYLVGLYGFGFFSLLCGLSVGSGMLVLFRLMQGIFGALLVPGSLSIINTHFDPAEKGKVIGQWSAWSGAFTVFGPLVGGYLIEAASWRWIFFINIPFIALCIYLVTNYVSESKDRERRTIDVEGSLLAAAALGGITYGLIQGPVNHWKSATILPLLAGILFTWLFLRFERGSKDPMMPLSLFKSGNFTASNIMTFAMYGALSGFMFALVIYMQTKLGYSPIIAGISLLPVTILLLLLSGRAGKLSTKYGPRAFMTIGPILAGIGILSLASYKPGDSYVMFLLPRVILFGIGLATTVAPLTTTVITSVHEHDSGIASAINNTVSRVGGLLIIAILGLMGTEKVFKFSMVLSGFLAVAAGIMSLVLIKNPRSKIRQR